MLANESNEQDVSDSPVAAETGAAVDDKSVRDQMADLVKDARQLAYAEVEYYRAKLSANMAETKRALTLFAIGGFLVFCGLVALILGLLLALAPLLTPLGATALVAGLTLGMALLCIFIAIKRVRKLPLDGKDPERVD